ncbi:tetratricopeptide repeat protein [Methanosarcina horonobensis]|uniref:tetratricopeptide repeat protein n=1 Tax=Methanosarcina horonobensis TaxID=418008 RepID=UPI000AF43A32|nr:tetratricopeptide repeat protein [Methanosarcina horonobensis]
MTLFERYKERLKDLDPELITAEDEISLKEAFRHAKEIMEPKGLISWFVTASEPFYRAAAWEVLLPIYKELLDTAERELGPEAPETASALNGLAGIYRYMGKHEEALKLFSRALSIREKSAGSEKNGNRGHSQ